jgi:outer membrane protein
VEPVPADAGTNTVPPGPITSDTNSVSPEPETAATWPVTLDESAPLGISEISGDFLSGSPLPAPPAAAEAPAPLPPFSLQPVFDLASGEGLAPMLLTVREVVRMALVNNTDIQIQRLQPELGDEQVRFAKGAFDPRFAFSTQYAYSSTPQNAVEFVSTGGLIGSFDDPRNFTQEDYALNWQLEGKTPLGTQYSLGLNQQQARNDINIQIPPSIFFPEYTSVLGLTVTQPLLRNFGPAANLAELRVARLQRNIGWYEWQQAMIKSLAECVSLYVDLIFASENLRVREGAVRTARLLEEQNIRRVRAGRMRPSDVWEAQTSLANNADLAMRAINAYVEAQNALKRQILSEKDVAAGPTPRLEPVDALYVPAVRMDRDAFMREAFNKRPEYLQLQDAAEQEGIKVRYARNQVYPQVDLMASYGLTGLDGNFGDSFSGAFAGQGPAFSVGVMVSVPLGNQKAAAGLQSAKLRQQQSALALRKSAIDITMEIDTAISFVRVTQHQVKAATQTTTSAKLTAEAQEKLLDEGKATTFDVVRLQNDYADARSRELAALANHRKAVLRLAVARGMLLDELGVRLEEEADSGFPPGTSVRKALPAR